MDDSVVKCKNKMATAATATTGGPPQVEVSSGMGPKSGDMSIVLSEQIQAYSSTS